MGSFLMFLFLLFVVGPMVASIVNRLFPTNKPTSPNDATVAVENRAEKRCPPHAWFSQEVRDSAGNKLFDRTVCKYCGPLRND